MGPRAGLDRCGKSRPPPGFDHRTVQTVASRYTDYSIRPTTSLSPPKNAYIFMWLQYVVNTPAQSETPKYVLLTA